MERETDAPYRLGLPAWAFPGWRGVYFDDWPSTLASYARVFNAVEGNTTFYRIPDEATVARWAEAVANTDLRISFKLPSTVTHERRASLDGLHRFLGVIRPLAANLGPLLVQYPAWAGVEALTRMETVVERVCEERQIVSANGSGLSSKADGEASGGG